MKALRPYSLPLAAVLLTALAGEALQGLLDAPPPAILFLIPIALAAWFIGGRGGLVATAAAVVASLWFFHRPSALDPVPSDDFRIMVLALMGCIISFICESLHEARRNAERERTRLRTVLDHLPAGVVVADAEGRVLLANPQVAAIMRHAAPAAVVGAEASQWVALDAEGNRIEPRDYATARALRGETTSGAQIRYVRGDETETWLEVNAAPVVQDGVVTGAVTMFHDIGEKKRMAAALDESRHRLHLAERAARCGYFDYDLVTGRSMWSAEMEALYGMAPGSSRGGEEEWSSRVHPDDLAGARRDIARAMENGEFISEWRVMLPEGAVRWVQAQGTVYFESGKPVRIAGVNMDVTARREAETRLRAAEGRLAIALEAARLGRWHLDLATWRLESSPTCRANFGRTPEERFTFDDLFEAIVPEDRAMVKEALRAAIDGNQDYSAEYRVTWPDGEMRWIGARGRARYDAAGRPLEMDGVTIDLTERKLLEEALREKTRSLQESGQRKDHFLAILGHELRNPIAPMRNAVEILRVRGSDPAVLERVSGILGRQLANLTRLVDELLDVARIASGKVRLELNEAPLGELVDEAVEQVEPLMEARGHALAVRHAGAALMVRADRARVVQVLANVLNNAAKYTDPGGRIAVTVEQAGAMAVVSVQDNGIGMQREAQARVFELFSQVDGSVDRSLGGLGLGLNVARRLVEMHGGRISVHSDGPGQGSCFRVEIPLAEVEAQRMLA
jgi:PAS domain S-box-containing protein